MSSRRSLAARAAAELEYRRRIAERPPVWTPYPGGPQERACNSLADITGYGGAAGGGKTDLGIGLPATQHRDSIIFRREYPQLKGIVRRAREILGKTARYNGQDKVFNLDNGGMIELGACQHPDDVEKYQGRPHDYICFDEATQFPEFSVRFLFGWLRSTYPGQRCRALLTFNPPVTEEGLWIISFFAPWLDETHPNPAVPGELRWFTTLDGKEVERPDGEPFVHKDERTGKEEIVRPMSRTFFPAKLSDNPALASTNYGAGLQMLPEPIRSQLLYGDFKAGIRPDAWQAIPTAWIKAAVERWKKRRQPETPMTHLGCDVAHGGDDKTVLAPRWGDWFGTLDKYAGIETPDGRSVAVLVMKRRGGLCSTHIDAISWGASAAELLAAPAPDGFGCPRCYPINVANSSDFRDRSGQYGMVNLRAEMFWRLREELDPDHGPTLCLPDDPELVSELAAPRYKITPRGIQIESKDEIAKRLKRSTNCADAVALTFLSPAPSTFAGKGTAVSRPKSTIHRPAPTPPDDGGARKPEKRW